MNEPIVLVCELIRGGLIFPDNLTGICTVCDQRVQFRPHAPDNRILRCTECALDLFDPACDTIETTPQMIEDYLKYVMRKMQ